MSSNKSLLVELLAEELPPKALKRIGDAFASLLFGALRRSGLCSAHSAFTGYATPRRLAVHISSVMAVAPNQEEVRKIMPVSVALDAAGKPTVALRRAMAKLGREGLVDLLPDAWDGPDHLYEEADGKVRAMFFRTLSKGITLAAGLQNALDETLANLPIPKRMSYQLDDGWSTVHFVRPAHALVALHGADVVPCTALGLESARETRGHRFEAAVEPILVQHADHYAQQLEEQGAVVASFEHRRAEVQRQLQHAAGALDLKPIDDDALLDEVTALVERPNVLRCAFEREFLAVPPECLILTMKANQKYFPLLDAGGKLTEHFLVVSNIRPEDASAVIQGNERVVRPRLADAKFFFDQDRKKTLESRIPGLDKVVYHAKLGTMGQRVQRVQAIARAIGEQLGGATLAAQAERAALLAKADLLTDMVGEFPELQGVMGGYYARHDGESEAIAFAIEDHYKPRFAGDSLPRDQVGIVLALADKLETLVGLFGIGQVPTGDKDPFALRRHALGLIRMLVEKSLPLSLHDLINSGYAAFARGQLGQNQTDLTKFVLERFAGLLREQGFSALEVDAVMSMNPVALDLVPRQLEAVRAFAAMPEAASLAAANKRITNILKKSEADGARHVEPPLFVEDAERALHGALTQIAPRADALFEQRDYAASLRELAALKGPVDTFFDRVMVNADDAKLRANRLALLAALHRAMNRVADLSRLAA